MNFNSSGEGVGLVVESYRYPGFRRYSLLWHCVVSLNKTH